METISEQMQECRKQLEKGSIQKAYKGLMENVLDLKTHFKTRFPDYYVSGGLYTGTMDMTYFSVVPESLKQRNLKVAIVFLHEAFRFETWLAGVNTQVQTKYWKLLKDNGWNKYHLVPSTQGFDSIIEHVLVSDPDFSELGTLREKIENETLKFIQDIEDFVSEQQSM